MKATPKLVALGISSLFLAACADQPAPVRLPAEAGGGGSAGAGTAAGATGSPLAAPHGMGFVGMRRLSKAEYARTLSDLLGIAPPQALGSLPEDILTPYDNDYGSQVLSPVLIAGISDIAREAAASVLADPARRAALVPCTPSGPDDAACFDAFVTSFGRRVLHRPLRPDETQSFSTLRAFSVERNDFWAGVGLALRALLQDVELLYRVEVGTPVSPGLVRLDPYELAARLSYTLLGGPPDLVLLDAAAAGQLETEQGVRDVAARLLADPRAAEQSARFHALWLSYANIDVAPPLKASMLAESSALIERVVFREQRPWAELFTFAEAFVDENLAPIYGVPGPVAPGWVTLPDPNRRGLLGQAGFLAAGAKFGDTSPVLRGLQVRTRLLCQHVPAPPPTVNADQPPEGDSGACKSVRYKMHAESSCASCHALLDPVGFGLEQYGADGRLRQFENGRPDCAIDGAGELKDLGVTFQGPAGLAQALVPTGQLERCAMQQLTQFVVGRQLDAADQPFVDALSTELAASDQRLAELLLDLVASPAFRHRVTERSL